MAYPLEHLIGAACPNGINTVAEGITRTLEETVRQFPNKPVLPDHGVPEHDVMKRISESEYSLFIQKIRGAASLAREALETDDFDQSVAKWKSLLGDEFPSPESDDDDRGGGFTKRTSNSTIVGGNRFA